MTPPAPHPDLTALVALAARAVPLREIQHRGYRSMLASSDLHPLGYSIREWLHLTTGAVLIEYHARMRGCTLPRITVETYADQCAVHRALGIPCVPPGERWSASGQLFLFA